MSNVDKICKNCKFWGEYYYEGNTLCNYAKWVEKTDNIKEDDFAYFATASDDYDLDAGIKTGPLFGCNKFQSKE